VYVFDGEANRFLHAIPPAIGRSKLASALLAVAPRSVGRHQGEAYQIQVFRYTCEDLDVLRRRLRTLERDIERLLDHHDVGRLLTTIEGIGPQTSARLVATFGDFTRFRSGAALASSVGVIPALRQSGKRTSPRANLTHSAPVCGPSCWMPVLAAVRKNRGSARTTRCSSPAASSPRSPHVVHKRCLTVILVSL
jgi:transposase